MKAIASESTTNHSDLERLFALGSLSLIAVTWPLWLPHSTFPQIPFVSVAARCPRFLEWGILAFWLGSLCVLVFAAERKYRSTICGIASIAALTLVGIDQHRLQPWVYQFLIVSIVLALAETETACNVWRWLIVGIYAWSAWSKMDYGFFREHGPFLLDGLCHAVGITSGIQTWPQSVRIGVSALIPIFEFSLALGLLWTTTRRFALFGAAMMHISLLLALGPFGHRHQPGVLVWNVYFLIQNYLLFRKGPPILWMDLRKWRNRRIASDPAIAASGAAMPPFLNDQPIRTSFHRRLGNPLARCVVFGALFWPVLEPFGFCDHWPAWAVYAASPDRTSIFIPPDEISKLPENIRQYMRPHREFDLWCLIRIDRWSLDAVNVPIYPQDRFHVGVALAIARDFGVTQIRIVIEGQANRWTGKRTVREYIGVKSLETLANSYRFNAKPR